jgi:hypothetical protein
VARGRLKKNPGFFRSFLEKADSRNGREAGVSESRRSGVAGLCGRSLNRVIRDPHCPFFEKAT